MIPNAVKQYQDFQPKMQELEDLSARLQEKHHELRREYREIEIVFRESASKIFRRRRDTEITRKKENGGHQVAFCPKGLCYVPKENDYDTYAKELSFEETIDLLKEHKEELKKSFTHHRLKEAIDLYEKWLAQIEGFSDEVLSLHTPVEIPPDLRDLSAGKFVKAKLAFTGYYGCRLKLLPQSIQDREIVLRFDGLDNWLYLQDNAEDIKKFMENIEARLDKSHEKTEQIKKGLTEDMKPYLLIKAFEQGSTAVDISGEDDDEMWHN